MSEKQIRQVVLDTETTGLNPLEGHRIIEIGCVELINRRLTKNRLKVYINPGRMIDEGAELIIHNAPFDLGFLNHKLSRIKSQNINVEDKSTIFDTLPFARKNILAQAKPRCALQTL